MSVRKSRLSDVEHLPLNGETRLQLTTGNKVLIFVTVSMTITSMGMGSLLLGSSLTTILDVDKDASSQAIKKSTILPSIQATGWLLGTAVTLLLRLTFPSLLPIISGLCGMSTMVIPWCMYWTALAAAIFVNGACVGVVTTCICLITLTVRSERSASVIRAVQLLMSLGATLSPLLVWTFLAFGRAHNGHTQALEVTTQEIFYMPAVPRDTMDPFLSAILSDSRPADETAIVYNGQQHPVSSDTWNHSSQTGDSSEHKEMKIGEVQTYLDAKVDDDLIWMANEVLRQQNYALLGAENYVTSPQMRTEFNGFQFQYICLTIGILQMMSSLMLFIVSCRTQGFVKNHCSVLRKQNLVQHPGPKYSSSSPHTFSVLLFMFAVLCFVYTGVAVAFGYLMPMAMILEYGWKDDLIMLFTAMFWLMNVIGCICGIWFGSCGRTISGLIGNAVLLLVGALLFVIGSPYSENVLWLCAILIGLGCSGSTTHCIALLLRITNKGVSIYGILLVGSYFGAILLPLSGSMLLHHHMATFSYVVLTSVVIATIILCVAYVGYIQPLLMTSLPTNHDSQQEVTNHRPVKRIYNQLNLMSSKDHRKSELNANNNLNNMGDKLQSKQFVVVTIANNDHLQVFDCAPEHTVT